MGPVYLPFEIENISMNIKVAVYAKSNCLSEQLYDSYICRNNPSISL